MNITHSISHATYPSLAEVLWPSSHPKMRAAVLTLAGALLLTASAKIQIPFYPVPQTLQTMVVLLLGMAFGLRLGSAAVCLYLFSGAIGLPVFAGSPEKGIGIAYLIGPTGGYLFGFMLAAAACGALANRGFDRTVWHVVAAMFIGNALIYIPGLLWLGSFIGWDKPILQYGMYPFLLGDVVKIIFAAVAVPSLARVVRKKS